MFIWDSLFCIKADNVYLILQKPCCLWSNYEKSHDIICSSSEWSLHDTQTITYIGAVELYESSLPDVIG